MEAHALWAILLADGGRELTRIALTSPQTRSELPLRDLAHAGLRHDATAMILVRDAANSACTPCPAELSVVDTARRTLGVVGLRLHDYILWHGDRCVSLRQSGRL